MTRDKKAKEGCSFLSIQAFKKQPYHPSIQKAESYLLLLGAAIVQLSNSLTESKLAKGNIARRIESDNHAIGISSLYKYTIASIPYWLTSHNRNWYRVRHECIVIIIPCSTIMSSGATMDFFSVEHVTFETDCLICNQ
nr:hypothetical protein CFP56_27958 [Quercus suber]